ncbi:hypothetical protein H4O20_08680 [Aequorivita sp. 609]|uniref:toxin-antitoxin system YwqK family antitoxin n=1 Tax=Aequorivita TaxID=153265 RepID=UPI00160A57BC|nr:MULTISPECIES: hypothetical protein [Aequorivita]MBB6681516.1 hypothetical protein [Aequorivita sp. 609]
MKKTVLHIIILLTVFSYDSYSQKKKSETAESIRTEKIDTIIKYRENGTKDFLVQTVNGLKNGNGLLFDLNENIIGFRHYENDTLNGYGILLNENNFRPKYLYEANKGKRDGVLISFYDNGKIKKFRSADTFSDSQILRFHENGVIREIGQTKSGRAHGIYLYFDENGILEKKVKYENGNIVK